MKRLICLSVLLALVAAGTLTLATWTAPDDCKVILTQDRRGHK